MRRIVSGALFGVAMTVWIGGAWGEVVKFDTKVKRIYMENSKALNRIEVQFVEKTGCNNQGKQDPNGTSILLQYGNAETKYMMAILAMAKASGKRVTFWLDTSTCELKNLSPLD